jgi:hypothetical protein
MVQKFVLGKTLLQLGELYTFPFLKRVVDLFLPSEEPN